MKPYLVQIVKIDKSARTLNQAETIRVSKSINESIEQGKCPVVVLPYGYRIKTSRPPFYWIKWLNPKKLFFEIFG